MANTYNPSELVSRGTKQPLHSASMLVNTVDKSYSKDFTQKKYISGQTVTIEIEPQATITAGRVGVLQSRKPKTVSATLGQYNGVFDITSIAKAYDQDGEAGVVKYGNTIGMRLVREIERTGFSTAAQYVGQAVGTPGSEPGSFRTWATARARLDDQLAMGKIYAAASPLAMVALADSLKGAQNPTDAISSQYKTGQVQRMGGLDFYQSNSTYRHTAGTADNTTPLVDDTISNGDSTIHIDGLTAADTITVGTHLTFSTSYAVDPETKVTLPYLQKYTVTTLATMDGAGEGDITVSPAFYDSTDSRQNISNLPADGDTVIFDTEDEEQSQSNLVYAPDCLSLISVPLSADSSGGLKESFTNHDGLSIRTAIHPRDAINDTETLRVDACWAWTVPRPEHGCIVHGD